MSLRTRVPATGAGTSSQKPCIGNTRIRSGHFRRVPGQLVQCQLVGSSAIPTSWYSASLPGGSPDELVLHQLARRAPSKLVLHKLARRAPSKLVLHQLARRATTPSKLVLHMLARRAPSKLVLHQLARRAPSKLVLHKLARRAPSELVLHPLARRAPGKLVLHQLARRALGQLLQCQLAGSSAIPTSRYSARSPRGSPDELILHQLARRAPDELVLHQLSRTAPEELVLHQLARRAPGELILHQLLRRALGELALYQLSVSWQAGIFLPACQEATSVSWYGMYQLAKRHSQRAGTLPALQEVLPASWYCTSLPGGSPNELVLISAHQGSLEYSAPARWGSAGERFCRVGIWRVPACFFTPNPDTRTGTRHPSAGDCWKPTGTRRQVLGTRKQVPDDIFSA
ncbi:hypothetical protein PCASD_06480 [Puccinia coronata f. sp. avenae]|uniref:Uncharacterized protein n=1 Tax=Puccinia coronata f. sp. avenae TaxID=200324 RepID=A0A2N5V1V0_9BASI|nr:hypothetical protein PCASD_06480 [Puccinia coronata f. sp. avenae]